MNVALVTGAGGGIGRAACDVFVRAGWRVVGVDRGEAGTVGEGCRMLRGDMSDPVQAERVLKDVAITEKRLDALVNNAAVQICKPLVDMLPAEWDEVMNSNVRSVYLALRNAHGLLAAARGCVVNVSSVHAVATSANIAAYAASKGAVLSLTRAMAIELAAEGIRVNAVLPGATDTPMLRAGLARGHAGGGTIEERLAELGRRTVIGRVAKPEEIAETILFLADDRRSSFITGQAFIVDGGATARLSTE